MRLAHEYAATSPAMIRVNYGVQRSENGGMAVRAIAMLPTITGAWKQQGGGLTLSTSATFKLNKQALQREDLMTVALGRPARILNMNHLGKLLTDASLTPPVKALFVYASNPAAVCPNHNLVVEGLRREDLFTVVHEQFFTDTTDYADVVLAGDDVSGTEGAGHLLRTSLSATFRAGNRGAGRGLQQRGVVPAAEPAHGI